VGSLGAYRARHGVCVTADCSNTKALWADLTKYKAVWRETWQQDRDDFQQAHNL
jgi:hypothetical protein